MKIGFIGVGAMGKPMACNLLKAGYAVSVFDLSENAVKEMQEKGAKACGSVAELSQYSDMIFCSLPNAEIVQNTMLGEKGVFKHCQKGTIIADMSSVSPACTKKMEAEAKKYELRYMDAPVSGGVAGAAAGTLTIMIGADKDLFEQTKAVFSVLGKNIYHVGEAGAGDAIKLVNNLLLGCNMAAIAEALILGTKCGLSMETMKEVISVSSGKSYAFDAKVEKFIMEGNFSGGFAVDLQHKDLLLALESAKDERVPVPMTAQALQLFEAARAKGQGREDMSCVVKVWEDITGARVSGSKKEKMDENI